MTSPALRKSFKSDPAPSSLSAASSPSPASHSPLTSFSHPPSSLHPQSSAAPSSLSAGTPAGIFAAIERRSVSALDAAITAWRQRTGSVEGSSDPGSGGAAAAGAARVKLDEALSGLRSSRGVTVLHAAVWQNHVGAVERLLELGCDPDAAVRPRGHGMAARAMRGRHGRLIACSQLPALCDRAAVIHALTARLPSPCALIVDPFHSVPYTICSAVPPRRTASRGGRRCTARVTSGTGRSWAACSRTTPRSPRSTRWAARRCTCCRARCTNVRLARGVALVLSLPPLLSSPVACSLVHVAHPPPPLPPLRTAPDTLPFVGELPSALPRDSASLCAVEPPRASLRGAAVPVGAQVQAEVFSWGNGANYQLGTGSTRIQRTPARIDGLATATATATASPGDAAASVSDGDEGASAASGAAATPPPASAAAGPAAAVVAVAAGRFHSAAVTARGELFTWGFGRGGRLGHPDFDVHSGQVAVILPRRVTAGLGGRAVRVVAAAKHHMLAATHSGELFSWGSNREGRLGYPAVDSQATPRRVAALRQRVVAVAAGNKHSAALTGGGEVFTWGCNTHGQLGYGTSNSTSSCTPRIVDHLKGRAIAAVAAAKRHTVVLTADGEAYTWGHRLVTPRRVKVERDVRKGGGTAAGGGGGVIRFHQQARVQLTAVAAGAMHSTVLSQDGLVFYWRSHDPLLKCHQVRALPAQPHAHPLPAPATLFSARTSFRALAIPNPPRLHPPQLLALAEQQAVAVAAGKWRTAVVTAGGSVYVWDASQTDTPLPAPAAAVAGGGAGGVRVGEGGGGDSGAYSTAGAEAGGGAVPPLVQRVPGICQAAAVAVGDLHSLAVAHVLLPPLPRPSPPHAAPPAAVPWAAGDAGVEGGRVAEREGGAKGRAVGEEDRGDVEEDDEEGREEGGVHELGGRMRRRGWAGGVGGPGEVEETVVESMGASAAVAGAEGGGAGWGGEVGEGQGWVAPLKQLCEAVIAAHVVDVRNVLPVLALADAVQADLLTPYCQHLALANLAFIATVAPQQLALCPPYVLAHLEAASRTRSSSSASSSAPPAPPLLPLSRALPTATAPNEPVLGDDEEEEGYEGAGMEQQQGMHEYGQHQPQLAYQDHLHPHPFNSTPHATAHAHSTTWHATPSPDLASALHMARHTGLSLSAYPLASLIPSGLDADVGITTRFGAGSGVDAAGEAEVARQVRAVRKKLQQVEMLEGRRRAGEALDVQQRAKVAGKAQLDKVLAVLEGGGPAAAALAAARAASAAAGSGGAASAGGGSGVGGSGSEAVHDDGLAHPAATHSNAADAAAAGKGKSGKKGGQGFSSRQSEAKEKEKAPCATSASPGSSKPVAIPDSMHSAPGGSATVGAVVPAGGALFAPASSESPEQRCQSPALPGTSAHTTAAASTSSGGSGKKGARKKGRKGGLSLFLAGDLERAATTSPTPATPAAARGAAGPSPSLSPAKPAWGIPRHPLPPAETDAPPVPAAASPARSLRDIQSEQQQHHLHCQPHTQPQQRQGRQAALHTARASISRPLGHSTSAAPGSGSGSSGGSSMASTDALSAVGSSATTGSSTRRGQQGQHGSASGLLGFVSVAAPHSASPGQAVHERVAGGAAQGAGGWRGGEGDGVAAGIRVSLGELLKASTQRKAHHTDAGGGVGKARAAPVAPWAKERGGEGAVGHEPVARSQGISIGTGLGRGGRVGQGGGGARQPVSLLEIQQQQLVAFLFQCMYALPNSIVPVVPVARHQELSRRRSQHCGSWGSPTTALLSASPSHAATPAAALAPQRPAASAPVACSPSSPAPTPSPTRFSAASSAAVPATPHGSSARTRASGSGGSMSAAAALATTTTGGGFAPAAVEAESRWYKGVEEGVRASSLRSIQIEEQAMRELKSFGFASVRVVRDG
ncbi:unnamed protein product [Closterium sp. Naga37s-1]|nr:unnamed protein product [Closterium sp. Naga37s-1]